MSSVKGRNKGIYKNMWQYLVYFLIGGGIVALVAFTVNKGNGSIAVIIGNLPVLFILNILIAYRIGGVANGVAYAKGSLLILPLFILFVLIMMMLLPRAGAVVAALSATTTYIITVMAYYRKRRPVLQEGELIGVEQAEHEASLNMENYGE